VGKKKGLTLFDLVMLGLGAIVGIGWALWVNGWLARAGGPIPAALGYAIAGVGLLPVAFCYAELSSVIKEPGGGMVYARKVFNAPLGKPLAFAAGWMYVVVWLGAIMWEVLFLTEIIRMIIPALPYGFIFWTIGGVDVTVTSVLIGILMILIFMILNLKGAKAVARFQNISTVLLIILGLVSAVTMFVMGDFSNLLPAYSPAEGYTHESIAGGILTCIVLLPFFLAGMDMIPQGIADLDPNASSKTVGKGVIICVIAAAGFYILQILACGTALDWHEFQSFGTPAAPNLFFSLFPNAPNVAQFFFTILLVSVVMGLLTTLNACLYALPRLLAAMGDQELLPRWFNKTNPTTKIPTNAVIFTCIISLAGVLLGLGIIEPVTAVSSIGVLITWMIVAVSVLASRKKDPDIERPFKVPGGIPIVWFTLIFCAILTVCEFIPSLPSYIGSIGLTMLLVVVVIGIVLYLLNAFGRRGQKAGSDESRAS